MKSVRMIFWFIVLILALAVILVSRTAPHLAAIGFCGGMMILGYGFWSRRPVLVAGFLSMLAGGMVGFAIRQVPILLGLDDFPLPAWTKHTLGMLIAMIVLLTYMPVALILGAKTSIAVYAVSYPRLIKEWQRLQGVA